MNWKGRKTMDESNADINAKLVLQKVERRTRLLKTVNSKSQRLRTWAILILFLFGYCWISVQLTSTTEIIGTLIPIVAILCTMIDVATSIVHKRIDALIELLEVNKMIQNPTEK
jgi:hypothetical protein